MSNCVLQSHNFRHKLQAVSREQRYHQLIVQPLLLHLENDVMRHDYIELSFVHKHGLLVVHPLPYCTLLLQRVLQHRQLLRAPFLIFNTLADHQEYRSISLQLPLAIPQHRQTFPHLQTSHAFGTSLQLCSTIWQVNTMELGDWFSLSMLALSWGNVRIYLPSV